MKISDFQEVIEFLKNDFEVLALKAGLKKIIKIETEKDFESVKKYYYSFEVGELLGNYQRNNEIMYQSSTGNINTYFISSDKEIIDKCISLEKEFRKGYTSAAKGAVVLFGNYLGYPSCCIKDYLFKRENINMKENYDTYSTVSNFINGKGKYNTYLLRFFRFISHIPCDFTCEKSLKYIESLFEYMKISDKLKDNISQFVNLPVLYFNEYGTIILNGYYKDNTLFYSDYHILGNNLSQDIKSCLDFSDKIVINEKSIIFEGNSRNFNVSRSELIFLNLDNNIFFDINDHYLNNIKKDLYVYKSYNKGNL